MIEENKDPEIQAISLIVMALEKIKQERIGYILEYINKRFGFTSTLPQGGTLPGSSKPKLDTPDIKTFLEQKDPKNDYQKVAVLAYYLSHYEGIDEINSKNLVETNKRAKGIRIADPTYALRDSKRAYGFFTEGNKGKQMLSSIGEKVVEALPNQEEAEKIVKEIRQKLSKRKKNKKKGKKEVKK